MAERFVLWVPSAAGNVPTTETVLATVAASTDQDVSVSSLPSAPIAGARQVRIRVAGTFTTAPGGAVTVKIRQGQGITGAQVPAGNSLLLSPTPAAGSSWAYEAFDTAPPTPITYSVTVATSVSAGATFAVCEIEEVN